MMLDFTSALVRWRAGVRLVSSLTLLSACSDGPYLMTEEYVTPEGQEEQYLGGGCIGADKGNGMGSGMAGTAGEAALQPAFSTSYEGTGDGVHFSLSDADGTLLVDRTYDEHFLVSGKEEEINAEVTGGSVRFVHRGSPKCEDIRPPEGS